MSQNYRHAILIISVIFWLGQLFGKEFVLSQTSIDVRPEDNPTSEPMPDAIVLHDSSKFLTSNPKATQIQFCFEVSDSTLDYDLYSKSGLYARAGIPEYWVIDIPGRKLYVHRNASEGEYQAVTIYDETEFVSLLSKPDAPVKVSEFLPISSDALD